MKKIKLNQMEQISGDGCAASLGLALAGVIVLAVFGGPFGWGTVAAVVVNGTSLAYGCGIATSW